MSGVYDQARIFCPVQQKETLHHTGWESEEPNVIDIQCVECYGPRLVSGPTVMEGQYRRLLRPEHRAIYLLSRLGYNRKAPSFQEYVRGVAR